MKERLEFREKLSGILDLAKENQNRITTEMVEQYFEEDCLSEEQIILVYDYLLSQKIVVKGYTKKGGTVSAGESSEAALTAEEEAYVREYTQDLKAIPLEQEGERERLYQQVVQGDGLAKARLVEVYLKDVVEIAKEMNREEFFLGDLVQEGNVSLLLAADLLSETEGAHEFLCGEIRDGIQALMEEQTELKKQDNRMVERVNRLDESIRSLTEDMGRKVTVSELAVFMDMEEDEILDIMKLAGEEIEEGTEDQA